MTQMMELVDTYIKSANITMFNYLKETENCKNEERNRWYKIQMELQHIKKIISKIKISLEELNSRLYFAEEKIGDLKT